MQANNHIFIPPFQKWKFDVSCMIRYDVPYVYTIVFAETRLGVTSQHSTHIISIIGNPKCLYLKNSLHNKWLRNLEYNWRSYHWLDWRSNMGIVTYSLRNMHDIMCCLHSIDATGRILPDPFRYTQYINMSKRNCKYTY